MSAEVGLRMALRVRADFETKGSSTSLLPEHTVDTFIAAGRRVANQLGRPVRFALDEPTFGIVMASAWLDDWPADDAEEALAKAAKRQSTRAAERN